MALSKDITALSAKFYFGGHMIFEILRSKISKIMCQSK